MRGFSGPVQAPHRVTAGAAQEMTMSVQPQSTLAEALSEAVMAVDGPAINF